MNARRLRRIEKRRQRAYGQLATLYREYCLTRGNGMPGKDLLKLLDLITMTVPSNLVTKARAVALSNRTRYYAGRQVKTPGRGTA